MESLQVKGLIALSFIHICNDKSSGIDSCADQVLLPDPHSIGPASPSWHAARDDGDRARCRSLMDPPGLEGTAM
ncbi:hypothetical protein GCM10010412_022070 [Nonomuraea recticatena]|uniref:Uncharacterized protein n=1 Tax=Nonomuraea recticatena TaxID=46178 RepID=A0ABN3RIU4_9ACTN